MIKSMTPLWPAASLLSPRFVLRPHRLTLALSTAAKTCFIYDDNFKSWHFEPLITGSIPFFYKYAVRKSKKRDSKSQE